jgi:hypothetical protein
MAKPEEKAVFAALRMFADEVTANLTSLTRGEPEEQLRAPFVRFMQEVGNAISRPIVCTGDAPLASWLANPDCGTTQVLTMMRTMGTGKFKLKELSNRSQAGRRGHAYVISISQRRSRQSTLPTGHDRCWLDRQ